MQHLMDLLLHYEEEAFDIDLEDLVEIRFRLLCQRPVRAGNTSIIECVIETAENVYGFRDNLTHFFWYAKVRSKEECSLHHSKCAIKLSFRAVQEASES